MSASMKKLQKKVALAVPLLGIALVMTLAHPVTFAALVSFAGFKSWRELKALEDKFEKRPLITREKAFVVGGLGAATALRFVSLPMTLAIGLGAIANDIAASLTGIAVGRRFIKQGLSQYSPKKSWEGAIAGITAGTLTFCSFAGFSRRKLLAGILVAVAGVAGDLQESAMKRDLGIKDASSALGEHGGWTDRIDNLVRSFVVGACFVPFLRLKRKM